MIKARVHVSLCDAGLAPNRNGSHIVKQALLISKICFECYVFIHLLLKELITHQVLTKEIIQCNSDGVWMFDLN